MPAPPSTEELKGISQELKGEFTLAIPEQLSFESLLHALTGVISQLIAADLAKLIFLLYRLDISEKKVRAVLEEGQPDSAEAIARLIMERQTEKIRTRRLFRNDDPIPEEDKW